MLGEHQPDKLHDDDYTIDFLTEAWPKDLKDIIGFYIQIHEFHQQRIAISQTRNNMNIVLNH